MTLATLKTKLSTLTGTSIGSVYFDWQKYLNEPKSKSYPVVLWNLDGAKFNGEARTNAIQKTKIFTITVFAIALFNSNKDKIAEWDILEGYFNTYLNAMNETAWLSIENINNVQGRYVGEGMISADQEIGIMYEITLKTWC